LVCHLAQLEDHEGVGGRVNLCEDGLHLRDGYAELGVTVAEKPGRSARAWTLRLLRKPSRPPPAIA
jgi:hypothetical protein